MDVSGCSEIAVQVAGFMRESQLFRTQAAAYNTRPWSDLDAATLTASRGRVAGTANGLSWAIRFSNQIALFGEVPWTPLLTYQSVFGVTPKTLRSSGTTSPSGSRTSILIRLGKAMNLNPTVGAAIGEKPPSRVSSFMRFNRMRFTVQGPDTAGLRLLVPDDT